MVKKQGITIVFLTWCFGQKSWYILLYHGDFTMVYHGLFTMVQLGIFTMVYHGFLSKTPCFTMVFNTMKHHGNTMVIYTLLYYGNTVVSILCCTTVHHDLCLKVTWYYHGICTVLYHGSNMILVLICTMVLPWLLHHGNIVVLVPFNMVVPRYLYNAVPWFYLGTCTSMIVI